MRLRMLHLYSLAVTSATLLPSFLMAFSPLVIPYHHGFDIKGASTVARTCSHSRLHLSITSGSRLFQSSSDDGNKDNQEDRNEDDETLLHPMASTSFLSHCMLKVPSVDETVQYWTEKGGRIRASRPKETTTTSATTATTNTIKNDEEIVNGSIMKDIKNNGSSEPGLRSAFIEMGCLKQEEMDPAPVCFALELVSAPEMKKKPYSIGNCISYIGVSMLLQFQNNLLGAIQGETPAAQGEEPNGIPVKSSASAPGDLLARLALRSTDLESTLMFYTQILGMEAKAQDESMICLRYDNDCFTGGVPTTLVFDKLELTDEKAEEDEVASLDMGDCLDHFVIATTFSIDKLYTRLIKQQEEGIGMPLKVFMKPTEMFGKQVLGIFDPNGYKVIVASS